MVERDSPSPPGEPFVVSDARQAQMLTDPRSKAFFVPFLARDRRVSDAATELGCSVSAMLYRVRTLLHCGLLEIVREETRPGRAVKIYRSAHDAYFVPFTATPYDTLEQRVSVQGDPIWAGLVRSYADALRRSNRFGHLVQRIDDHTVQTTDRLPDRTPGGQALFWSDSIIQLRDADARELLTLVAQWYERAQQMAGVGTDPPRHPYLCLAALLPYQPASA